MNPPNYSALHALYVRLSGKNVPYGMSRVYAWERWAVEGWTENDLALVIGFIRRKIRKGERRDASLRFDNLIIDTDRFCLDLVDAKAEARAYERKLPAARASVLKSTGRDPEPPSQAAKPIGDYIRELRLAINEPPKI